MTVPLRSAQTMLFLGGRALSERGLRAASRISAATGVRLLAETFPARMERGAGVPVVDRLAYLAEQAEVQLAGLDHLILAGARAPVSFFAYPGRASDLVPAGCSVSVLADRDQDVEAALEELADQVAAGVSPVVAEAVPPSGQPWPAEPGLLDAISLANTIAASLPEHAIVVDEANTSGFALPQALARAPRHTLLTLTGGSIGQGLPAATGAAIAAPDRPVLSLEADGSALYTIQALWTQAREQLNVTTVLINNAAYAILRIELARTAAGQAGERASRMLNLSGPTPDFTQISTGLGVPATRVTTAGELDQALRLAYAEPGPHLIEAIVPCHPDDVRRAKDGGVDGIYWSNHGGRQADGGLPALDCLPAVVDAAGGLPVLFDSGIRSGADVIKALALGARGVAGRPNAYGSASAAPTASSDVLVQHPRRRLTSSWPSTATHSRPPHPAQPPPRSCHHII